MFSMRYNEQEAIRVAREESLEEGIEKGIEKGIKKEKLETAEKLLKMGLPVEIAMQITELSKEEVMEINKRLIQ